MTRPESWLNTAAGRLTQIAKFEAQFRALAESNERRREWFAEPDQEACARGGLNSSPSQCMGFSVPLVFAEGGSSGTAHIADLYEVVSFLGDLPR